ncbi:hypothetical protein JRQ81_017784, partial [Phrynocephalus forsythii]
VVTRQALDAVGLRGRHFGTHSFHIDTVSTVSVMGFGTTDIQAQALVFRQLQNLCLPPSLTVKGGQRGC